MKFMLLSLLLDGGVRRGVDPEGPARSASHFPSPTSH